MSWLSDIFGIFRKRGIMGVCRHDATYCMMVYGEKYPARVAVGWRNGQYHSQAQAKIDGVWTWLTSSLGTVYPTKEDPTFRVDLFATPDAWWAGNKNLLVKEED